MPNANSPADTRCPADSHSIECRPGYDKAAPGVCAFCSLGTCSGDGIPMTPEQCAESRRECPTPDRNEVYCPSCLAEIVGDREAVPVAVEEEQTVKERMTIETDGDGYHVAVVRKEVA